MLLAVMRNAQISARHQYKHFGIIIITNSTQKHINSHINREGISPNDEKKTLDKTEKKCVNVAKRQATIKQNVRTKEPQIMHFDFSIRTHGKVGGQVPIASVAWISVCRHRKHTHTLKRLRDLFFLSIGATVLSVRDTTQ